MREIFISTLSAVVTLIAIIALFALVLRYQVLLNLLFTMCRSMTHSS